VCHSILAHLALRGERGQLSTERCMSYMYMCVVCIGVVSVDSRYNCVYCCDTCYIRHTPTWGARPPARGCPAGVCVCVYVCVCIRYIDDIDVVDVWHMAYGIGHLWVVYEALHYLEALEGGGLCVGVVV
jgi:hypothetical protein